MELFKKITNPNLLKYYIAFFVIYFLMNNLIAIGSDNKSSLLKSKQKYDEFEKIYRHNSAFYSEYDNLGNQLKTFFGLYSPQSETSNYPDISIINMSDELRKSYKSKLNDMAINETLHNVKKEAFFKN